MTDHIAFDPTEPALLLLDQRILPHRVETVRCRTADEVAAAIRDMVVRGAPAIGISAAWGLVLAHAGGDDLARAAAVLLQSRPTAVNLRWAVERMLAAPPAGWLDLAAKLHREDIEANQALGAHGAKLLPAGARVLTHCNAGALATGGWGTALGIVRTAHQQGRLAHVWVDETRPWLQGARLTAWELARDGIPCTLHTDSMAASMMADGKVDAVIVGADRVARNGDVANKIGTLGLAVLARHFRVPFYVAVPTSTLDPACPSGADIPIEHRGADEIRGFGGIVWAADVPCYHPAFDVTPAALVTAWITERGAWTPEATDINPHPTG
jgi:methylthioribose-1-phosphate isomerase